MEINFFPRWTYCIYIELALAETLSSSIGPGSRATPVGESGLKPPNMPYLVVPGGS